MASPLSSYAVRLLREGPERLLETLPPLLVWHAEPGLTPEPVLRTMAAGAFAVRPRSEDPVVFEVRKGSNGLNAFAMGVTVGRTASNDVVLPDASISRFHAYLQQDARTKVWQLVDAESHNGTRIGPLRLQAGQPHPLTDGVVLRFGELQLTFHEPASFLGLLRMSMAAPSRAAGPTPSRP